MRSIPSHFRIHLAGFLALGIFLLAGCATTPNPRTDDPWEGFNRKMYAFNDRTDRLFIRPVAMGYRKITTPDMRRGISNFFANVKMPITIVNDLLQAEPKMALRNTGRFAVNTTIGIIGFLDPASDMGLPSNVTDFGITLAKWHIPEGPYIVLPLLGPTNMRDIWSWPVDSYLDPMSWFAYEYSFDYYAEYWPYVVYFISMRSDLVDAESLLKNAYDPYAFYRDAYRQRRLYLFYYGAPPAAAMDQLRGTSGTSDADVDQLLDEQHQYEQSQKNKKQDGSPQQDKKQDGGGPQQ